MLSEQHAFYLQQLQETTVRVCKHVAQSAPVLQVIRSGGGEWYFLCGQGHSHDYHEGLPMSLEEVIKRDVSLNKVAALEPHDFAERPSAQEPWTFGDQLALEIPATIEEHGWFVAAVHDESTVPHSYFAYTIGLPTTLQHPELIMLGQATAIMPQVLNELGTRAKTGTPCIADTEIIGLIANVKCVPKRVHPTWYRDYLGYGLWYHGSQDFDVFQIFWSDKGGLYPFEDGCNPAVIAAQPDLSKPKQ